MQTILNKPYKILWLAIPILMLLSLLKLNEPIDIQQHDTYYVLPLYHLVLLGSVLLWILGFLYWLVRGMKLINWMTVTHVVLSLFLLFVVFCVFLLFSKPHTVHMFSVGRWNTLLEFLSLFVAVFILSQLLFFVNLIISLFSKLRNKP